MHRTYYDVLRIKIYSLLQGKSTSAEIYLYKRLNERSYETFYSQFRIGKSIF